MAWELTPELDVILMPLVKGSSCPECWRLVDVVHVRKGSAFSDIRDYSHIFITPVLSKLVKKIVAGKMSHILEGNALLLPSQFSYRRGLGICDALVKVSPLAVCSGRGHGGKTCLAGLLSCI